MLSVIIPTFNEMKLSYIERILSRLHELKTDEKFGHDLEVICVDSNSEDGTRQLIEKFNFKLLTTNENSRAARLNQGVLASQGQMILLHHPRSLVDKDGYKYLIQYSREPFWGAFRHQFDQKSHRLLDFTSWYSNEVRGKQNHIFYLDHCIFFYRELLSGDATPVPVLDIFEDTALSEKLNNLKDPILLPFYSTTSAIRFETNGIWNQAIMNQVLKIGYKIKIPHRMMNKIYERGLALNSKYKSTDGEE